MEMDFEQIEAEFAGHVATITNGKGAAKWAREATKSVIAMLPAYEAAYQGNVSFSEHVATTHGVTVRTVDRWREAPALAARRKEADRIRRALIRAKAKLKTDKKSLSNKSKSQPIRLDVVNLAGIQYAALTDAEKIAFANLFVFQQKEEIPHV